MFCIVKVHVSALAARFNRTNIWGFAVPTVVFMPMENGVQRDHGSEY